MVNRTSLTPIIKPSMFFSLSCKRDSRFITFIIDIIMARLAKLFRFPMLRLYLLYESQIFVSLPSSSFNE